MVLGLKDQHLIFGRRAGRGEKGQILPYPLSFRPGRCL